MVMTTNREELLDAAFTRPGRVKKIRMDNLQCVCFQIPRGDISSSRIQRRFVATARRRHLVATARAKSARGGRRE